MRVYFGGQIMDMYRGDSAAIITHRKGSNEFDVFLYQIGSEEYDHLTGVRSVSNPIDRAYIGINNEAGNDIARAGHDLDGDSARLLELDKLVVIPHFLIQEE